MPSADDIRSALHTLDLVICAAEDIGIVGENTIEGLRVAYNGMNVVLVRCYG